jgi:hypothetical protein
MDRAQTVAISKLRKKKENRSTNLYICKYISRVFHLKSITQKPDLLQSFRFFALLQILVKNDKLHTYTQNFLRVISTFSTVIMKK